MKYDRARRLLLDELKSKKGKLVSLLQGADRDFECHEKLLKDCIELQSAADVLGELELKTDEDKSKERRL